MIAEHCTTNCDMARLGRLVSRTRTQLRQVHAMFNRVDTCMHAEAGACEEAAEVGWRCCP